MAACGKEVEYRYDNKATGSYYYKNTDGSTYYHNYKTGYTRSTPPTEK